MALMPFLMAGDPDLSVTAEVLLSLQAAGADMATLRDERLSAEHKHVHKS